MSAEEFVEVMKMVVEESAVADVVTDCVNQINNSSISNWYNSLDASGKECLEQVVKEVASTVMFGVFCVLDGVRAIEDGPEKGALELYYIKKDKRILLNNFNEDFLHDIYQSKL